MASSAYLLIDPVTATSLSSHPDNFLINLETGYGIEQVRKLNTWVQRKPFSRQYKLAMISRAEQVSVEGQNALLKTLEEPPSETYIFLTTRNKDLLLPTIRSRCHVITVEELTTGKIAHGPSDSTWTENIVFVTTASEQEGLESVPELNTVEDAFLNAKKLSGSDRAQLQELLEKWGRELTEKDPHTNYRSVDLILKAKEALTHNANVQHVLEILFLEILKSQEKSQPNKFA